MEAYDGFVEKPEFYSDSTVFLVTMPNRSEATLINKKTQLQDEKTQLHKQRNDEKIEKLYIQRMNKLFRGNTVSKLISIYRTYGFEYSFNRDLLADHLNTSKNYASQIIKKCRDANIVRMESRGVYYFVNPLIKN